MGSGLPPASREPRAGLPAYTAVDPPQTFSPGLHLPPLSPGLPALLGQEEDGTLI